MTDEHGRIREWAAAFALGALDAEDRRTFETHLAACDRCRTELADFAPLPGLLARIGPDDIIGRAGDDLGLEIASSAASELHALQSSRRSWRRAAYTGLTAAAVLAIALLTQLRPGDPDRPSIPATLVSSVATSADVSTSARGWGNEIRVELTGLPKRDGYKLWAVDRDGRWSLACTWGPTSSGNARVTGATEVSATDLTGLVVTSTDRTDVLVEAATAG